MIHLRNDSKLGNLIDGKLILKTAKVTLDFIGIKNIDLTLLLTQDEQIRELNREYRGMDKPTDVLSFPANEKDPDTGRVYLGDVILSIPRAGEIAKEMNHPLEEEVQLLTVHGILHLLGYDHIKNKDKIKMWKVQSEILRNLNISPAIINE